jgi:hypothetical protein
LIENTFFVKLQVPILLPLSSMLESDKKQFWRFGDFTTFKSKREREIERGRRGRERVREEEYHQERDKKSERD